jgi:hypothetical protein
MPASEDITMCPECYALIASQHVNDHRWWHDKLKRQSMRVLGDRARPRVSTPPGSRPKALAGRTPSSRGCSNPADAVHDQSVTIVVELSPGEGSRCLTQRSEEPGPVWLDELLKALSLRQLPATHVLHDARSKPEP